jgi:hypothetical protein
MCANGLYLDAARLAASGLDPAQQQVLAVTARACHAGAHPAYQGRVRLQRRTAGAGCAIASGKPEHVLKPLEKSSTSSMRWTTGRPDTEQIAAAPV